MIIQSDQFGNIEYSEDIIIHFNSGIFGFEHLKDYIIIDDEETQPFRWLQSVEEEEVCFPMLDPFLFFADYQSHLPKKLVESVKSNTHHILSITTLKNEHGNMTINLKGPVIIETNTNSGQQIILNSEEVPTSYILN